jgi:hypothetical protein
MSSENERFGGFQRNLRQLSFEAAKPDNKGDPPEDTSLGKFQSWLAWALQLGKQHCTAHHWTHAKQVALHDVVVAVLKRKELALDSAEGAACVQFMHEALTQVARDDSRLTGLFTNFSASTPWLFLDIDRDKAAAVGVKMEDLFETLQVQLGSSYINNFNRFGRSWQVNVQADAGHRADIRRVIDELKVPNANGEPVPLSTLVQVKDRVGPSLVMRYNLYPAAAIYGEPARGTGSTSALTVVREHFDLLQQDATIPPLFAAEWTEMAFMQIRSGATATFLFRQFFLTIPDELAEAARIDGAGPLKFFWDVVLPLSRTSIAALFVIQFIYGWNQYLWPLLITTEKNMTPIVLGVTQMISRSGDSATDWNLLMATVMLAMLPPAAIVIGMQRWFVKGLVETEK